MKKIKMLSISNSFGVNLQQYASQIAKVNDLDLDLYVLYIGGCSLERHVNNLKANAQEYMLYHNGVYENKMVSILEGLKIYDEWDFVLTQQVSQNSGLIDTYEPFLSELYDYVVKNSKFKRFGFQETWSYSQKMMAFDCKEQFRAYNFDENLMIKKIRDTVNQISKRFENAFVINSGDVVKEAEDTLCLDLHDDYGFHLNSLGCYLIGANLVKMLTNKKLSTTNIFVDESLKDKFNVCKQLIDFLNK